MTGETSIETGYPIRQSNLDCIEPNLWLGNLNAAKDEKLLQEKGINYILTVNSFPLSGGSTDLNNIKYIEASDSPSDDLLTQFEEANHFIENGLKHGGVLVHCYCGVSRSATIVISYVMKKKKKTLKAAYEYVKSKRESIGPNPGFISQLQLFETMNFAVDKINTQYKMFRLYIAKELVKAQRILPESCTDIIKPDPLITSVKSNQGVYKCRKCRRILAYSFNILPHAPNEKYSWRDRNWSKGFEKTEICQEIYFIEPLKWMEDVAGALNGKLVCPNVKCGQKLGAFSWLTGCLCPCGTTVSPGFYLIPSKVDKKS